MLRVQTCSSISEIFQPQTILKRALGHRHTNDLFALLPDSVLQDVAIPC